MKRQEVISSEKVCEEMRQWRVDHRGKAVKMNKESTDFFLISPHFSRVMWLTRDHL